MNTPAIEAHGLTRKFGHIVALNGLSFQVQPGEIFSLVGPNGAGKTTTIRMLLGLCRPDAGKIRVFGYDVQNEFSQIGMRLGIVLENQGIHEDLSGQENLDYHGRFYGLNSDQRSKRIEQLLKAVGLLDRAHDRVKVYSKGMRQRLSLALALLNDPDLLLLDEPFDGIDTETHRQLRELIFDLSAKHGKSIFLTSHNLDDVERLTTRVAIIHKGQLLACGTVDALQRQIGHNAVKISFAQPVSRADLTPVLKPLGLADAFNIHGNQITVSLNGNIATEVLIEKLALARLPIREVTSAKNTLEEVYFAMLSTTQGAVQPANDPASDIPPKENAIR